ncbi:MAG: hypothetical protein D3916_19205 [Candidatus Electrothrix sp. MAN1_4]|nr:hypothetical protein [Candidatus Electrothrix sp. MAN1_4]
MKKLSTRQKKYIPTFWECSLRNWAATESDIEELITVIRSCGKVAKLTRTPLLLNMLIELPKESRKQCYHSWANFIETLIGPIINRQADNDITPRQKMMALEKIAAVFYQHDQIPPAIISDIEVNEAIQDTLKEYHKNEAYQDMLLEELTANSKFLVAVDDGAYYAFVNKYFQKYFAARYFLDREKELLNNYRKYPEPYSGVLRLWVGISESPDDLITDVSEIDPLLCLTLLADVQSPPKDLLESTLKSVENKIDSFTLPDAHAGIKQIDEYFSNSTIKFFD